MGARSKILNNPCFFRIFNFLVADKHSRTEFVANYILPKKGDRVLDIGCGFGDIIEYLPDVDYMGFDSNRKYINAAKKRYPKRGTFSLQEISREMIGLYTDFDIALAIGVLHHLPDETALILFELAKWALKPTGRLVTIDGCFMENQSKIAQFLLKKDRGDFVRTQDAYLSLASLVFKNIKVHIRKDLLRVPYTHIIMECSW